jgi:hypothetical protein
MKLLARYMADFNRSRRLDYWDHESPGPWSTLMVVLAVVGVFLFGR